MTYRARDSIFQYDAERARRADRAIRQLCEARGLDEYWITAHRLIAACEGGFKTEDALALLVRRLPRSEAEALAHLLVARLDGRDD